MVALLFIFTLAFAEVAPPKCFTEQDVKNEGCRVLCVRDGYHGGKSYKKGCSCYDLKESFDDYSSSRVTLGVRMHSLGDTEVKPVVVHVENAPWRSYDTNDNDE